MGEVLRPEDDLGEHTAIPGGRRRRRDTASHQSSSTDSSPSNDCKRGKKRRKARFTKQQRDVLNSWLDRNRHYPYPSSAEKWEIARKANLSIRQVEVWYANARKRHEKVQEPFGHANQHQISMFEGLTPLERYLSSDDEESADLDAIARAIAKTSHEGSGIFSSAQPFPTVTTSEVQSTAEPWLSSFKRLNANDIPKSYDPDLGIAVDSPYTPLDATEPSAVDGFPLENTSFEAASQVPTVKSQSSICSAYSFGSRQGRRKHPYQSPNYTNALHRPQSAPQITALGSGAPYACSLCPKVFKSTFDRRRHENSIHNGTERWVCRLHEMDPPPSLEGSNSLWRRCTSLSEERRTFYRKDKLIQHLRNTHRLDRAIVQDLPINWWCVGQMHTSPSKHAEGMVFTSVCEPSIDPLSRYSFASDTCLRESPFEKDFQPPLYNGPTIAAALPKRNALKRSAAVFTLGGSSEDEDGSSSEAA